MDGREPAHADPAERLPVAAIDEVVLTLSGRDVPASA
jgi:hypothetical protein